MCNINASAFTGDIATSLQFFFNGSLDPVVRDLIPPSVTHMLLKSEGMGTNGKGKALHALFRHFRAVRRSQLRNLQEVHIACRQEADNAYKQQCNNIVAEGEREGVAVHLHAYEYSGGLNWDE